VSATVLFYFYAAIALAGALVLVTARNLVHAAMGLFATLVAIAGLYLVLGSEFLAAMQLFVYGGAITVLVLFGLMLGGPALNRPQPPRRAVLWAAGAVSLLFFVAVAIVLWRTEWHVAPPHAHDTASIAAILFSRYVLPFEIAGLSLTIALIGAVVIAREDDVMDDASQLVVSAADGALAEGEGDAA
jgi:NADH:ubiquinone oxidoreductase subunit 6 (subunit J)